MIVLCCVVLYDFVHCLLLRRNNKYISGKTDDDVFYTYIHIQTNNACTYYMRIVTGAVTDRQTDGQTVSYKGRGENDIQQ